jgi:hypothetical protein
VLDEMKGPEPVTSVGWVGQTRRQTENSHDLLAYLSCDLAAVNVGSMLRDYNILFRKS